MDDWDDLGLVGSVCDLALAELVVDAASLVDAPEEVVASWDPMDDAQKEPPAYTVVQVSPFELAVVQEAAPVARPQKKKRKEKPNGSRLPKWQPFARGKSLESSRGAFVGTFQRRAQQASSAHDKFKTSKLPTMGRTLTDILHKQPSIRPRPRRKPKSRYGQSYAKKSVAVSPKRQGGKSTKKYVAEEQDQNAAWLQSVIKGPAEGLSETDRAAEAAVAAAAAAAAMLPMECEGMPLMVGPDGEDLMQVQAGVTEAMLIAELKELDAMRLVLAEVGGRPSGLDSIAAAEALADVQQRALARLNAVAELERRMQSAQDAVEASAEQMRRALDAGGGGPPLTMAEAIVAQPPANIIDIAFEHGAIDRAGELPAGGGYSDYDPADALFASGGYMNSIEYSDAREQAVQTSAQQSAYAPDFAAGASPSSYRPVDAIGGFLEARQQRSRHIGQQLQRLQEESRRLQEQSTLLTDRAMEMQRAAGIWVAPKLVYAVPAPPAYPAAEAAGQQEQQQHPQGRRDQQRSDPGKGKDGRAPAAGDGAAGISYDEGVFVDEGDSMPAVVVVSNAAPKGAAISWSMPARHQPAQKQGLPPPQTIAKKAGFPAAGDPSQQQAESGQTPAYGNERQHTRTGSADSFVDNVPMLPRWADLVSSPLMSPLKLVRKQPAASHHVAHNGDSGSGGGGVGTAPNEPMPQPPHSIQWLPQVSQQQHQKMLQQMQQYDAAQAGGGADRAGGGGSTGIPSGSEAWAAGLVLQQQQQQLQGPLSPRQIKQQNRLPEDVSVKFPRRFLPAINFSVAKHLAQPAPVPQQYGQQQYGQQQYGQQQYGQQQYFGSVPSQKQASAMEHYMMQRMMMAAPPTQYQPFQWHPMPIPGVAYEEAPPGGPPAHSAAPGPGNGPAKRGTASARHPGKAGPPLGKLRKVPSARRQTDQPEGMAMASGRPPMGGMMQYGTYPSASGAHTQGYGPGVMGGAIPMYGGAHMGMPYQGNGMPLPWGMPPIPPPGAGLGQAFAERAAEVQQQQAGHYMDLHGAVTGRIEQKQQAGLAAASGLGRGRRLSHGAEEPAEGGGGRPAFKNY